MEGNASTQAIRRQTECSRELQILEKQKFGSPEEDSNFQHFG